MVRLFCNYWVYVHKDHRGNSLFSKSLYTALVALFQQLGWSNNGKLAMKSLPDPLPYPCFWNTFSVGRTIHYHSISSILYEHLLTKRQETGLLGMAWKLGPRISTTGTWNSHHSAEMAAHNSDWSYWSVFLCFQPVLNGVHVVGMVAVSLGYRGS